MSLNMRLLGRCPQVKLQEQDGDERQVNLQRQPARGLRQPVPTAQETFAPAKEQFDFPALFVCYGRGSGLSNGRWRHSDAAMPVCFLKARANSCWPA
jgi:hypothetical protein